MKEMEIEVQEDDSANTSRPVKSMSNNASENCNPTQFPNHILSADLENGNIMPSTPAATIPLVLDNITNNPRSLIQDVFSNSPTIKCHDEDRLSVGTGSTQLQQPVGDYIKGVCF